MNYIFTNIYETLSFRVMSDGPLLPLVYKTETSTLTIRERKSLIVPGTYKSDQSPVVMVVAIVFFQNAAA